MSSELPSIHLTTDDLRILQNVLRDCGYTVAISFPTSSGSNLADKLLISLYQGGMTDPAELSDELSKRFGRTKPEVPLVGRQLHRDAIRGLQSPDHARRGSKYHHLARTPDVDKFR